MLDLKTTILRQRELKAEAGTSNWEQSIKIINRERVNPKREKREFMPFKDLWKLAKKQHLICGICKDPEKPLAKDRRYTVLDHIDPQRIDFNHPENLQAAHQSCNAAKSAKNQTETSKMIQLNKHLASQEDE